MQNIFKSLLTWHGIVAALIVEDWQVRLAQTALWLAILGFHLPGWLKRSSIPVEQIPKESF